MTELGLALLPFTLGVLRTGMVHHCFRHYGDRSCLWQLKAEQNFVYWAKTRVESEKDIIYLLSSRMS
jgi:hypothetical protein